MDSRHWGVIAITSDKPTSACVARAAGNLYGATVLGGNGRNPEICLNGCERCLRLILKLRALPQWELQFFTQRRELPPGGSPSLLKRRENRGR